LNIKRLLFFLMTLGMVIISLSAQDIDNSEEFVQSYHSKGDQTFSIEAGLFIPLLRIDPSPGENGEDSQFIQGVNGQLKLGGSGILSYCTYLDSNLRLGGEFGGIFAYTLNDNMLYMIPITFKTVFDININTYFTIPLYLNAGITLNSYLELFRVDPIIMPGVGFNWNYDSEWSLGLRYSFWIIPEISSTANQSSIGVHSDLRLGVEYHF
jgi:hypothetical protein